jgi:hypothetical protein
MLEGIGFGLGDALQNKLNGLWGTDYFGDAADAISGSAANARNAALNYYGQGLQQYGNLYNNAQDYITNGTSAANAAISPQTQGSYAAMDKYFDLLGIPRSAGGSAAMAGMNQLYAKKDEVLQSLGDAASPQFRASYNNYLAALQRGDTQTAAQYKPAVDQGLSQLGNTGAGAYLGTITKSIEDTANDHA